MTTRLTIERLGHQGDGVAVHEGREVFVPFSLPGETVEGIIANGRMDVPRIVEPVAGRIKPACRHFKTCGGCATQHVRDDVLADLKLESVTATLKRHGLEPGFRPVATSPERSRRRAVFSARRTKKGVVVGFHGRASDVLVEVLDCALIRSQLQNSFPFLKLLTRLGAARKGEIQIAATDSLGGLDVDVREAKDLEPAQLQEVSAIAHAAGFARIAWNGDVVLELQPPLQRFGKALVRPPSGAFLQATQEGEDALLSAVREAVGGAGRVLDLFAGCGTFSLPLAENAEVHAVEGEADMLAALDGGWRLTSGLKRVTTEPRDLFRRPLLADEFKGFDAAVIDPPRVGAKAQVEVLAGSGVGKIAFVSCNPATFARDAEVLVAGGYVLDWVQVVDQFRWSAHSELAAQFSRG